MGSPTLSNGVGLFFVAKMMAENGERGEDEMVFQEGILLHLDKQACRASYQQRVRCVYGEPHKQTGPCSRTEKGGQGEPDAVCRQAVAAWRP